MAFSDLQSFSPLSILELKEFQKQSFVEFLKVRVGNSENAGIKIKNPDSESAVSFFCVTPKFVKNPAALNGTIRSEKPFDQEICLPPDGDEILRFTWTPDKPGKIRELVEIRALVKETGRQFAVRVILLGTSEAPPPTKKKTAKMAPNIKKPFTLQQNPEVPSAGNQERSDVTFTVPQRSVSTQGRNFVGAIDENFHPASSPDCRAAISIIVTPSSPRRETTFVVETKTTTIMNTSKVTKRSPMKGRNGEQFWEEEEISKTQTEETVVEKRRTVEVQQTDPRFTGGVKESASRTGLVYEGMDYVPASPLNSTVCPTGEAASKKFFQEDDVTLSAIRGNRHQRRLFLTPNGDAPVGKVTKQLDYAEGGVFLKPLPRATGPKSTRAPVKRLDLTAMKEVQSTTFNMKSMKTGAGDCGPPPIAENPVNTIVPTQNLSLAFANNTRPILDHPLTTSEQEEEWASFDDEPAGELTPEETNVLTEDAGKKLLQKLESQDGAQKLVNSVIQIQSWWRGVVLRRRFLTLKKAVIALQSMYKGRLVFQQFLTCRESAIKIQAAWRGYCTRKRDKDSGMRIRYVKERLHLMTGRADSREYLGNRTERALDTILNTKHLYNLRNALIELETTSRLSPESCEKICQRGVVAAIFDLMKEMNRSVAWHGISPVSAAILLNIAKFSKTAGYLLAQEFWAVMLVEHMIKNRPKLPGCDQETIFVRLATIFICLSHIPDAQFAIAQSKEIKKKMDSLYTLLKKTHTKELQDKSQNLLKNHLDKVVAMREVRKMERLEAKMLDVSRSPYDPQWVLRKERTAEDIKPLYAIKYLRMRYGLEDQ